MNEIEGSIAPKERINIRYVPATMGQISEAELPLKLVVLGNFLGKADATPVEERRMINVDRNSLSTVMSEAQIGKNITVHNVLDDQNGNTDLSVNLKFESFKDFEPDSLVQQVPELMKMMQLREALVALKGPLGNMPAFRKRMQQILENKESRSRLIAELEALHLGDLNAS
ncbi:type VI secretion system contractile sheath small subunit [Methylobacterium fujisawaense]|uniref:type VI secretion system contractile sheath small subunit n=1 Tax=Methylobacterium fujisawaense TaxID=107400 RepID=UPI00244C179B|nr:type VI secretion system contractile sheath small subunit [Methylobacterium fujisawaense]MDH3030792.1 type VI secretion system contractile sheath small subunit [Methylobacterium fujisawaense]